MYEMYFKVWGKFLNSFPPVSAEGHIFCAFIEYPGHISKIARNLQNYNNLVAYLFFPI